MRVASGWSCRGPRVRPASDDEHSLEPGSPGDGLGTDAAPADGLAVATVPRTGRALGTRPRGWSRDRAGGQLRPAPRRGRSVPWIRGARAPLARSQDHLLREHPRQVGLEPRARPPGVEHGRWPSDLRQGEEGSSAPAGDRLRRHPGCRRLRHRRSGSSRVRAPQPRLPERPGHRGAQGLGRQAVHARARPRGGVPAHRREVLADGSGLQPERLPPSRQGARLLRLPLDRQAVVEAVRCGVRRQGEAGSAEVPHRPAPGAAGQRAVRRRDRRTSDPALVCALVGPPRLEGARRGLGRRVVRRRPPARPGRRPAAGGGQLDRPERRHRWSALLPRPGGQPVRRGSATDHGGGQPLPEPGRRALRRRGAVGPVGGRVELHRVLAAQGDAGRLHELCRSGDLSGSRRGRHLAEVLRPRRRPVRVRGGARPVRDVRRQVGRRRDQHRGDPAPSGAPAPGAGRRQPRLRRRTRIPGA